MKLTFPVSTDKLSGIIRSYKDTGSPSIELYPSSTITTSYIVDNILDYSNDQSHWASNITLGLDEQLVVKIADGPFYITHYSIR